MLVLLASDGIEALRMWSLKVQLPRAPGGVIGEAVARGVSHALGFTGGTLALLVALAMGLSLYFRFSWLSVAERVGESIISAVTFARLRREAAATANWARQPPSTAKARWSRAVCASKSTNRS